MRPLTAPLRPAPLPPNLCVLELDPRVRAMVPAGEAGSQAGQPGTRLRLSGR